MKYAKELHDQLMIYHSEQQDLKSCLDMLKGKSQSPVKKSIETFLMHLECLQWLSKRPYDEPNQAKEIPRPSDADLEDALTEMSRTATRMAVNALEHIDGENQDEILEIARLRESCSAYYLGLLKEGKLNEVPVAEKEESILKNKSNKVYPNRMIEMKSFSNRGISRQFPHLNQIDSDKKEKSEDK